jgi:hypothetical protein
MININPIKEISIDDSDSLAKKYFFHHAKEDSSSLNEHEFNNFLKSFLIENQKEEIWESLKNEKLFSVYLNKEATKMSLEDFCVAFKEILVLVKGNGEDAALDVDFNFDESDVQF